MLPRSAPSRLLALLGALLTLALAGCGALNPKHVSAAPPSPATTEPAVTTPTPPTLVDKLGPTRLAAIPADTTQVVLVSAADDSATESAVTRWEKTATGWQQTGAEVPAHNGYNGWSADRRDGDGTSPIGMFSLTAAAGRLPDPGTQLPYEHRESHYTTHGTFMGGNLAGAFDYVVAIDFNRVPGSPPSDRRRPDGRSHGGDVWFHVDHHSPTHACVSLPLEEMRNLLLWLDPDQNPVVVMGPETFLRA